MRRTVCMCACAAVAGCGGGEERKPEPDQRDVEGIAAAVSDIVFQCGAVRAGYVEAVDAGALARDVDLLLDADRRLSADARFRLAAAVGNETTTLRKQTQLALRRLKAGCSAKEAARLGDGIDG